MPRFLITAALFSALLFLGAGDSVQAQNGTERDSYRSNLEFRKNPTPSRESTGSVKPGRPSRPEKPGRPGSGRPGRPGRPDPEHRPDPEYRPDRPPRPPHRPPCWPYCGGYVGWYDYYDERTEVTIVAPPPEPEKPFSSSGSFERFYDGRPPVTNKPKAPSHEDLERYNQMMKAWQ